MNDAISKAGPARQPSRSGVVAVLAIAALVALPEALIEGADLRLWGSVLWRPLSYQYGAFWAGLLYGWTPNYAAQPAIMFLTYAILHTGPGHMVGNLLGILTLGRVVTEQLGAAAFLMVCLLSVLGGGLAFGLISRSPQPMVGASGLVFGLAGAWAWGLVADQARGAGRGRLWRAWPLVAVTAGLALFNLIAVVLLRGVLAWETHLGGYLAGLVCAMVACKMKRGP